MFIMMKLYAIAVCLIFSCQLYAAPAAKNLSRSTLETAHYKIVHDTDNSEVAEIANLLEFAYSHFNNVFTRNGFELLIPSEKLTWYCFTDSQSFSDHALAADGMNLYWLTSYYSAKTNSVCIVKPGNLQNWKKDNTVSPESAVAGVYIMPSVDSSGNELTMILHEAAHQLAFNTGLQKQKVMYPVWFSEGLAVNFENSMPNSVAHIRLQRVCRMYNENRLLPLNEFISITRMPENSSARKDIYAQSSIFFKFLSERHPDSLRNYMSAVYKLRPGWRSPAALHTEFISAFGPVAQINLSWQNYLYEISSR